jgi:hypothetical protein
VLFGMQNRIHLVLFDMHKTTLSPCLAAIDRIIISVMPGGHAPQLKGRARTFPTALVAAAAMHSRQTDRQGCTSWRSEAIHSASPVSSLRPAASSPTPWCSSTSAADTHKLPGISSSVCGRAPRHGAMCVCLLPRQEARPFRPCWCARLAEPAAKTVPDTAEGNGNTKRYGGRASTCLPFSYVGYRYPGHPRVSIGGRRGLWLHGL